MRKSFCKIPVFVFTVASILYGCHSDPRDRISAAGPWQHGVFLPAEPQQRGDTEQGEYLLLNGDYMSCGLPYKMWSNPIAQALLTQGFGGTPDEPPIASRTGLNEGLPYFLNAFAAADGAEVVNANCLMCHGGMLDGELVIGLPKSTADFTGQSVSEATKLRPDESLMDLLGLDEAERKHMLKISDRGRALAPWTGMRTVGMNPAEMYAVVLMVHHDRDTLAWSDDYVTVPRLYAHDGSEMNVTETSVTSDPPPWWRAHKKNALFYNGMARGDHRGTMALATSVCVDTVERAQKVDEQFLHIQSYIASLRAPAYTRSVNMELAETGEEIFVRDCAGCHGTYSENEEDEWYPNLLFPLEVIGTDPVVAEAGVVHAPQLVEWYNNSFYGRITHMEPSDPFPGYMAPPLDGIWATAPFLHNGSVPTIELVLNSTARPTYWKRVDYDSSNFNEDELGWPYLVLNYSQADAPEAERKHIYDTSYFSQSNAGHTFGDHLTVSERRALLEYLKTL